MTCVLPRVLYERLIRPDNVTVSGATLVEGFNPEHAVDLQDFTLWRVEPSTPGGVVVIEAVVPVSRVIDTACLWLANDSSTSIGLIQAFAETTPGAFSQVGLNLSADRDTPQMTRGGLGPVTVIAGGRVRFVFGAVSASFDVRQIGIGRAFEPPLGQRGGLNPPTLPQGVVRTVSIARDGSFIASSVKRVTRQHSLELEYMTEAFVRDELVPLAEHMQTNAFWYAWDYDRFPDEIAFSICEDVVPITNMDRAPYMMVTYPLRSLV